MKIRLTRDLDIPLLDKGKVLDVHGMGKSRGRTVYFVHHAGNYLGISEEDCEIWESQK